MKKFLILFVFWSIFLSCEDNDKISFGEDVSELELTFEAIPGGAIMKYKFPENSTANFIEAKYKDFKGNVFTVLGTHLDNSITMNGFIEAEDNVQVKISLLDSQGNRSKSATYNFSTKRSAASAIFDELKVESYWNGFKLSYSPTELSDGFIHVAYLGENALTDGLDTILLKSYTIDRNGGNYYFSGAKTTDNTSTAVVWTEDFRGNIVKKKVFKDIETYATKMLPQENLTLTGNYISSVENDYNKFGWKYLFDGDKNGARSLREGTIYSTYYMQEHFTFISDANGVDYDGWIVDLGTENVISNVRIYAQLSLALTPVWNYLYQYFGDKLPCEVKVYASNDMVNWEEKAEYYQHPETPKAERWCYAAVNKGKAYDNHKDLEAADPCYLDLNFDVEETKYRYIKVQVLDVYEQSSGRNNERRVTFNELEVYVKK